MNDTIVRTDRYSIVASTLQPYGLCRVVACRVVNVSSCGRVGLCVKSLTV